MQDKLEWLLAHDPKSPQIPELEKKIIISKRNKRSKVKGADYEGEIRDIFNERFPLYKLKRVQRSGGAHKDITNCETIRGDIANFNSEVDFPFHMECKNCNTWSMPAWWKQATKDCVDGKTPIVVFKQQQKIKNGKVAQKKDDFVMLRLEDFLDLFDYYYEGVYEKEAY